VSGETFLSEILAKKSSEWPARHSTQHYKARYWY